MCACASAVGVWREKTLWAAESEKGAIIKTRTAHGARCFRGGRNLIIKTEKCDTREKKKKYTNSIYAGPKFVEFIPEAVWKSYQFDWASRRDFVMKALPRSLARSQCNTAKTDQSEQWCLRKSLPIVPSVTCKKDFLASFFSAPPHCSIEECSKQTFAQMNINYLNKTITCSSLVPPLWEEIVFKWNDWVKFMLGVRGGCCHP